MLIVHGADTVDLIPLKPGGRRRPLMLAVLLAFVLIIAGLVAFAVSVALDDGSGARDEARRPAAFSTAIFSRPPDASAQQAVVQTGLDKTNLEQLTAQQAQAANAKLPFQTGPNPAAKAFVLPIGDGSNYLRALDCMSAAVYYEAATEPLEGQRAVAQVVLNRMRHAAYPHSVCGVVFQGAERTTGCQFSFTCDGSMLRAPMRDLWLRARAVASAALGGYVYAPVGLATHYHADYVLPYWAPTLRKQTAIGRHIFYRWPGGWGTPPAFVAGYQAKEMDMWASQRMIAARDAAQQLAANTLPSPETPVTAAERPVLMSGAPLAGAKGPEAAAMAGNNRVYLMSRNPEQHQGKAPAFTGGVTGGVIMPGAQMPMARPEPAPAATASTGQPNPIAR